MDADSAMVNVQSPGRKARTGVLLIDDEVDFAAECRGALQSEYEVSHMADPPSDPRDLPRSIDAVLLDIELRETNGVDYLERMRSIGFDLPVIMITKRTGIEPAIDAIKRGADNYVTKRHAWSDVRAVLRKEIAAWQTQQLRSSDQYISDLYEGHTQRLAGESGAMRRLRALIERLAERRVDVLITGETGVGKSRIARAINAAAKDGTRRFVPVSLPTIPETLFESTLFGHEPHSFNDARLHRGLFETVGDGDLFLDEIGEVPPTLQPKLLAALDDEGWFYRVGSNDRIRFKGRVIAATNQSLESMVDRREFREDLLRRLARYRIEVPPLRERPEDILPVAEALLARARIRTDIDVRGFATSAKRYLEARNWERGNAGEMGSAIEAALVWVDGDWVEARHFEMVTSGGPPGPDEGCAPDGSASPDGDATGEVEWMAFPWNTAKDWFARRYVENALRRAGTVVGAARLAGKHKRDFQRLMRRLRIELPPAS